MSSELELAIDHPAVIHERDHSVVMKSRLDELTLCGVFSSGVE
jgi:limonene-1,2-epoxide hydrolase